MATTLELVELIEDIHAVRAKARKLWAKEAEYHLSLQGGVSYGEGSSLSYLLHDVVSAVGYASIGLQAQVRERLPRIQNGPRRWSEVADYVRERLA